MPVHPGPVPAILPALGRRVATLMVTVHPEEVVPGRTAFSFVDVGCVKSFV